MTTINELDLGEQVRIEHPLGKVEMVAVADPMNNGNQALVAREGETINYFLSSMGRYDPVTLFPGENGTLRIHAVPDSLLPPKTKEDGMLVYPTSSSAIRFQEFNRQLREYQ